MYKTSIYIIIILYVYFCSQSMFLSFMFFKVKINFSLQLFYVLKTIMFIIFCLRYFPCLGYRLLFLFRIQQLAHNMTAPATP